AHDLRLTVVAEGIESQEQIATLAELECDYGQGFLIGEPMMAKQVVEALSGGVFTAGKPVFAGIWDRLGGRKPAEPKPAPAVVAKPAEIAPPAKPAAEPAEEPLSPELAAVKAAIDGATQALAKQAVMDTPPLPAEPAAPEPPPVSEEKPAVPVSFRSTLTLPLPEPLPPPPPPTPPAESATQATPEDPPSRPKPGTAPFTPRFKALRKPLPLAPKRREGEPARTAAKTNGAAPPSPPPDMAEPRISETPVVASEPAPEVNSPPAEVPPVEVSPAELSPVEPQEAVEVKPALDEAPAEAKLEADKLSPPQETPSPEVQVLPEDQPAASSESADDQVIIPP
ncbi:MAG: EAL domain-containing protein, partial [Aestuariivirgaceae bacterium]